MTAHRNVSAGIRLWRRVLGLCLVTPAVASAITCIVPSGTQPTVGAAVRDITCTTIQLAGGPYPENVFIARDVAIAGAGAAVTLLAGAVEISGIATDVVISGLAIGGTCVGVSGCWQSLLAATGGARFSTSVDVRVTQSGVAVGPCRLFADGFESAGMLAWSNRVP